MRIRLYLTCKYTEKKKDKAAKTKGSTKCNVKNLFNVALLTLKPPQINSTISCPTQGITLIKLVITVVPQRDI